MRLVIVSAVFIPEPVVSASLSNDIAVKSAELGFAVTVLCPVPTRPLGVRHSPQGDSIPGQCIFPVVRLKSFTAPQSNLVDRGLESLSLGWHVCKWLHSRPRPSVVYANVWPIFCPLLIGAYCRVKGIPVVLHIQDVYPEALQYRVRSMPKILLAIFLRWMDGWGARLVSKLVVITPEIRRIYLETRGVSSDRVVVVPNWCSESSCGIAASKEDVRIRYGLMPRAFSFVYFGNIGPLAGVRQLIEAFSRAKVVNAQLVIVGDGSEKRKCIEYVERLCIPNVEFVSEPEVANSPLIRHLADVLLLPMKKGTGGSSVPSKLMGYMFSGKPILASVDENSETARCIRSADCGWVGGAEDVEWLASQMARIAGLPMAALRETGARGLQYAKLNFDKGPAVGRLIELFIDLANPVKI